MMPTDVREVIDRTDEKMDKMIEGFAVVGSLLSEQNMLLREQNNLLRAGKRLGR